MNSGVVRPVVFSFLVCAAFAFPQAGEPDLPSNLHRWVVQQTENDQEADFFIVLREQADVSQARSQPKKRDKGRYVFSALTRTADVTQAPLRRWLDARGVRYRSFWIVNAILVQGGNRQLAVEAALRPDVERVEGNPEIHNDLPIPVGMEDAEESQVPSNYEALEWNIAKVNAPGVWALGFHGEGIVVGGMDTGYRWTHTALKSQYRGWNGVTADHDYNWHDSIHIGGAGCGPDSPEPCDDYGHGTHTMGIILGDDGGSNQIGMAPQAKWIGCRAMDLGIGSPASYLECFQFFLAPTRVDGSDPDPDMAPDVTNNSWGCPPSEGCSWDTLQTAVDNQKAAGIMTVASAGNDGSDCDTVTDPPAVYASAYSVGSTDSSDHMSHSSSRGYATGTNLVKPDIVAPGSSVRSALNDSDTGYATMGGTSQASPHVAGAVALLWSAWSCFQNRQDATETVLNETALDLPGIVESCGGDYVTGPNNTWGHGRLDILAAVNAGCPCESWLALDETLYNCNDTVEVTVLDSTPGAGPWTVQAWSTADPTVKAIALANDPPGSTTYTGAFTTVPSGAGSDQVNVAGGATITVRWEDPDYCGAPLDVDRTALADCAGPVISDVQVIDITDSAATVTWTTDEMANSQVTYGTSIPPGTIQNDLMTYGTSHSIDLTGLSTCTTYNLSLTSADPVGNATTDDNGGAYYVFKTLDAGHAMEPYDVESGTTGWSLTGEWRRDTCRAHGGSYAFKVGSATCPGTYADSTISDLTWGSDISLGAAGHGCRLKYWEYYKAEWPYDYCRPQISTDGGSTWTTLGTQYWGTGTTWAQKDFDLAAYTGNVRIRFEFATDDGSPGSEGWYLDDIEVTKPQPCGVYIVYQSRGGFTPITGDGDANFEPGEKWSVAVTLVNSGIASATNVQATLTGNGIQVCNNPGTFGAMPIGGTATYTYEFVISPTFSPCGGPIAFNVLNKTSTEETPAGPDQGAVFSIANVGEPVPEPPAELVIQPSAYDAYVNQQSSATNYGTATTMLTNLRTNREQDVLVQFDLSGIPAGATINSATLELYNTVAPASAYAVNVNRNTAAWNEATVTWDTKPAYASPYVAQITPTTAVGWKIWTVTSAVQEWRAGTYANYGFTVRPDTITGNSNIQYTFASRENATTGNRPILRVDYTPEPARDCSYVGSGECSVTTPPTQEVVLSTVSANILSWGATDASHYRVLRGIRADLAALETPAVDFSCYAFGTSTSVDISGDDPSGEAGRCYYYLVQGYNGTDPDLYLGPAGNSTAGPRIIDTPSNCD